VKKSIPLSVMAAPPSLAPDLSFLTGHSRTWIMGVLNATPDSFYAGSRPETVEAALTLAGEMVTAGADVVDLGGESTRPGAENVPAARELERVLPVLEALHECWPRLPLSVDTQKSDVAREALSHGASLINDISALRHDPAMAGVVAEAKCPVILMHMQGTPGTMQQDPHYKDVVTEVKQFFEERIVFAAAQGIREDRIILDPGIGFGKTVEHNLTLLKRLKEFQSFGRPLLIGVSRKSFIGRLLAPSPQPSPCRERVPQTGEGILPPEERLEGSLAAALWAVQEGACGLRVHDVRSTRRALKLWESVRAISS
jgi:dihydropteroate synthase